MPCQAEAVNIGVYMSGNIAGSGPPGVPSCDSLCLGLSIGLTIVVVVAIIVIVLAVVACRRRRPRRLRTGETSTDTGETSQHKTVIHVSTDNLADEHPYSHVDNNAFTPEMMDDVYLHPEQPIVFNSAV